MPTTSSDALKSILQVRQFKPASFGAAALPFFGLDQSWCFINHGAFGACLKTVLEAVSATDQYLEKQPLRFIDRELLPQVTGFETNG